MRKPLKRWGNNLVLVFTKTEEVSYNLKEGLVLDISEDYIAQVKERKKK